MAWCKVSSLTAAVSMSLKSLEYPASRGRVLSAVEGRVVDGWELSFFLGQALGHKKYDNLRGVMKDLEAWVEAQG